MTLPGADHHGGDELARMREKRAARTRGLQPSDDGAVDLPALLNWSLAAIEESGGAYDVRAGLLSQGLTTQTVHAVLARLGADRPHLSDPFAPLGGQS